MMEPELAHAFVKRGSTLLPKTLIRKSLCLKSAILTSTMGDITFSNPVGLAAGFDKNGEMISFMESLGFGFIEIGSVTTHPCAGNPRPRIFRLPKDESLINRMGLPNWGVSAVHQHLKNQRIKLPLGINVAKTPDFAYAKGVKKLTGIEDITSSFTELYPLASYLTINLSCPNTSDGRTFEDPAVFLELGQELSKIIKKQKKKKTVLVKLSPSLKPESLEKLLKHADDCGFDGFVVSNTSPERMNLISSPQALQKIGSGGLSGHGVLHASNDLLKRVYAITGPSKIIMGVGGIMSFEDLLAKLSLGASHFQVYTGLIYKGPFFIYELNKALLAYCKKLGVDQYLDLRGKPLKR
ncbi:quinone-dependent dihydroorotate dehydrogenase [bacterium]|nr:quinone-dependent dihydroorotate dehydrogenase [bacterium]